MITQSNAMIDARFRWWDAYQALRAARLYHGANATVSVAYWRKQMRRHLEQYAELRKAWQADSTAAALADAQAEVTRLREALAIITKSAEFAIAQSTKSPQSQHLYSKACGWSAAAEIATRAALETTPTGEATNENG